MTTRTTNWAGNVTYRARRLHRPASVDQLQDLVAASGRVRALGTGHSFNHIADTTGDLVCLADLPRTCALDPVGATVTVSAGMRYGDVVAVLHESGWALPGLGSLPHISVAGSVATGTHGSGNTVGGLATSVSALQMVTADGGLADVGRADADFPGTVVGLGALGVVTRLTLDLVPAFEVRQWVYDDLVGAAVDHLDEVFGSAYSASLFTDWRRPGFRQVWLKQRLDAAAVPQPPARWLGGSLADGPRHPIAGKPAQACTEQLGVPGPWHARLPHFRLEHTPSSGQELQSEYLLPREHAADGIRALQPIAERLARVVQVSELRTVAADDLWLSPCYRRDTVAIHFTWVPDGTAVMPVVRQVEDRLAPYSPRPHWGKLFTTGAEELARAYPRYADFAALMRRRDPTGTFGNQLLQRWFPAG